MFKYKTHAEVTAMTAQELETYTTEKRAHESKVMSDAIAAATKDLSKSEDVNKAIKAAIDAAALSQNEAINKMEKLIKEQNEAINILKEGDNSGNGSAQPKVAKELKEKKAEILKIAKGAPDGSEVVVKTLFQRSGITGNQQAYELPDIGQLAHRKLVLYDLFPKVRMGENNNGTVRYYDWDAATIARAASAKAEGSAFDESTAAFATYTETIKKIGDSLPVTEEVFEDEEMFAAELGMFLETNVKIVVDTQLATGTGAANTINGVVNQSTAYVPVAAGIQTANIYDLIVKMKETITKPYGSKYAPDTALMNITDINRMKLAKDHNDNYILPPFVSRDGNQVDGIVVIECNALTANTMVLCDRRYGRIYEKVGVTLTKGLVDNQFIEDTITLKARQRLLFLVRNVDRTGFLYCSDIDSALTTIESIAA